MKRIHREIADLEKEDLGPIILEATEDNLYVWKGTCMNPEFSMSKSSCLQIIRKCIQAH
jgi:ubiquitin-protein ligase